MEIISLLYRQLELSDWVETACVSQATTFSCHFIIKLFSCHLECHQLTPVCVAFHRVVVDIGIHNINNNPYQLKQTG